MYFCFAHIWSVYQLIASLSELRMYVSRSSYFRFRFLLFFGFFQNFNDRVVNLNVNLVTYLYSLFKWFNRMNSPCVFRQISRHSTFKNEIQMSTHTNSTHSEQKINQLSATSFPSYCRPHIRIYENNLHLLVWQE